MAASEGTIKRLVLTELAREGFRYAPVGVSVRHVHLSEDDLAILFGTGYQLQPLRALVQPGQYAAKEQVTVVGPKGNLERVRIIGPVRGESQVELSLTDAMSIGIKNVPIRMSGDLENTAAVTLKGPQGEVQLSYGCIAAARHLHLSQTQARIYGLHDGQSVQVKVEGARSALLDQVICRVGKGHELELHVDTDEANALVLKNDDLVQILVPGEQEEDHPFEPERIAQRVVFSLTGRSGQFDQIPRRQKTAREEQEQEDVLDLVTEQDINIAVSKGKSYICCSKKALITPAARDRAAQCQVEIRRSHGGELSLQITPEAGEEILDLVTAGDFNTAFRDNKTQIYCTRDALITPAARERMEETGIRIIRV